LIKGFYFNAYLWLSLGQFLFNFFSASESDTVWEMEVETWFACSQNLFLWMKTRHNKNTAIVHDYRFQPPN